MNDKQNVVLLLSGGKDSLLCTKILVEQKYTVHGLCIDGIQGQEKVGAQRAAMEYGIPLDIVNIKGFDEETWNPIKLIYRDFFMGVAAIKTSKKYNASILAAGVKKSDVDNPKLWWLRFFISFGRLVLKIFGIQLIFPVWDT